jgi:hypothetical protein
MMMRWFVMLIACALVACGTPSGGGGGYYPPDPDGGTMQVCTPGATVACACAGSSSGVQTCNSVGTGLGACMGCQPTGTPDAGTCTPNCAGRTCGDNGCGGMCGACPMGQTCSAGGTCAAVMTCQPSCGGRMCGPDGCGGSCGTCPGGGSCNPMTGTCCTPNCAGRSCGPDGCGGTCGTCTGSLACDSVRGTCTPTCTPTCAGRNCGLNSCGTGSCGTCAVGQSCSPSGVCQSACFAAPGDACVSDTDCCPDRGVTTRCVRLTGLGTVCTAVCATGADCASNCCASLTDGTRACNLSLFCANTSACFAAVGQSCSMDADCCRETSGRFNPTACTCFGASCSCHALCAQNSDCTSGCCARRTDGVRVCAMASACP